MVRRKDEIGERRVQNAQGGKGEVVFNDWLRPEEAKGHGRLFSRLVVPPGASIGYHEHHGEFEAYYVLSGEATISDNGEEKVLRAGDMNLCLDGSGHGTENRGSEDLVIIALIMKTLAE